jgi:hypothetical protein
MRALETGFLILALASVGGTAPADSTPSPWLVRAILVDELPCDDAYVRLFIGSGAGEPLLLPLGSGDHSDAEWALGSLKHGSYELIAQAVSCNGVPGPLVTLGFDYGEGTRRKEIYVGLRSSSQVITLDFLGLTTSWDGAPFVSIKRDGDALLVTNTSDVPLHRCQYEWFGIYEEFLVDGIWGEFHKGGMRDWPEEIAILEPGATAKMETSVIVVRKILDKEPRVVRPSSKRYTLMVRPKLKHFVTPTDPPWAPGGLPSCDRYRVELPADDSDPSITIWDPD